MTIMGKIKTAFERQTKVVTLRPGMGQGTAVTKVHVRDGLTCDIEDGPWRLTADMSQKWGGNNAGPNPGVFGRGAFGSCVAMGYMMWAAKLGVPINSLEIEVHADYDTRGTCGIGDVPAGYGEIRYVVKIDSSASEEEIRLVLDKADAHSPYHDVFARGQKLVRQLQLNGSED